MFGVQLLTPLLSRLIFSPFSMEKHYASVHDGNLRLFLLQQALSLCCSDIPYAAYRNISHVPTVLSCIQHLSSLTKLTHFNYEEDLLMCKGCLMPPRDRFYKCSFWVNFICYEQFSLVLFSVGFITIMLKQGLSVSVRVCERWCSSCCQVDSKPRSAVFKKGPYKHKTLFY